MRARLWTVLFISAVLLLIVVPPGRSRPKADAAAPEERAKGAVVAIEPARAKAGATAILLRGQLTKAELASRLQALETVRLVALSQDAADALAGQVPLYDGLQPRFRSVASDGVQAVVVDYYPERLRSVLSLVPATFGSGGRFAPHYAVSTGTRNADGSITAEVTSADAVLDGYQVTSDGTGLCDYECETITGAFAPWCYAPLVGAGCNVGSVACDAGESSCEDNARQAARLDVVDCQSSTYKCAISVTAAKRNGTLSRLDLEVWWVIAGDIYSIYTRDYSITTHYASPQWVQQTRVKDDLITTYRHTFNVTGQPVCYAKNARFVRVFLTARWSDGSTSGDYRNSEQKRFEGCQY